MIELIKSDNSIIKLNDDVNYWWVNQGQLFHFEVSNGFMQCRDDDCLFHHLTLKVTNVGDIVIHYANGEIKAISTITKSYFRITDHHGGHRRNLTDYYLLRNPIDRDSARNILENGLGEFPQPPFKNNGQLRVEYLNHLSGKLRKNGDCNLFPPNSTQKAISKKSFDLLFPNPIRIV